MEEHLTTDHVRRLLMEGEGPALDFKSQQYRFNGARDAEKAELLKDILAMANATRRTDAFILIGVDERVEQGGVAVGVTSHLEDASIQQFVNTKLNRELVFRYVAIQLGDVSLGVIHVPRQPRPFYLRDPFGGLKANVVYYRRGSSTAEANPDLVAAMGQEDLAERVGIAQAKCRLELADLKKRALLGTAHNYSVIIRPRHDPADFDKLTGGGWVGMSQQVNADYWRELADFIRHSGQCVPLGIAVINEGTTVLRGAAVRIEFLDSAGLEVLDDEPVLPSDSHLGSLMRSVVPLGSRLDPRRVEIERFDGGTLAIIGFGDVHAGLIAFAAAPLFIGPTEKPGPSEVIVSLSATNLPSPQTSRLLLTFDGNVLDALDQEAVEDFWARVHHQ